MNNIKLLSIDFDGTLTYVDPSSMELFQQTFQEFDISIDREKIDYYFSTEYKWLDPEVKEQFRNYGILDSSKIPEFREKLTYARLKPYELGKELRRKVTTHLLELYDKHNETRYHLFDGVRDFLEDQMQNPYDLIVLTNNNGEFVREVLDNLSLLDYFDEVFSPSTQYPDKEKNIRRISNIYEVETNNILHVGDEYGSDVIDVTNAGGKAVYLTHKDRTRITDENHLDVPQISELRELNEIINY